MRKSALCGTAVAAAMALGSFAPTAMPAEAGSAAPSIGTAASACHYSHIWEGRWHHTRHLICRHMPDRGIIDGDHPHMGEGDHPHTGVGGTDHQKMDGSDHSKTDGSDHPKADGADHPNMDGSDHHDGGTPPVGHVLPRP